MIALATRARLSAATDYAYDPLGYIEAAWPWGSPEMDKAMPYDWQIEEWAALGEAVRARRFAGDAAVDPIRISISSGRGTGKTFFGGPIVQWVFDCWQHSKVTITAGNAAQLHSSTWSEFARLRRMNIFHDEEIHSLHDSPNNMALFFRGKPGWHVLGKTWDESNPQRFQGQHARGSVSAYWFDEASAASDAIVTAAEGSLVHGMPLMLFTGNMNLNSGAFFRSHHRERHLWRTRRVDTRSIPGSSARWAEELVARHGEDSDVVRVHIRGLPPRAAGDQFVPAHLVQSARSLPLPPHDDGAPLVMGVDVARFGDDQTAIAYCRGRDARSIPIERFHNLDLVRVADIVSHRIERHRPDAVAIDETGMGSGVVDMLRARGYGYIIGVNFGANAYEPTKYPNRRVEMYARLVEALERGLAIPDDDDLEESLCAMKRDYDPQGRVLIESKKEMRKRGLASPDDADALALCFAERVARRDLGGWATAAASYDFDPLEGF